MSCFLFSVKFWVKSQLLEKYQQYFDFEKIKSKAEESPIEQKIFLHAKQSS